jgi:hypothetical protein
MRTRTGTVLTLVNGALRGVPLLPLELQEILIRENLMLPRLSESCALQLGGNLFLR